MSLLSLLSFLSLLLLSLFVVVVVCYVIRRNWCKYLYTTRGMSLFHLLRGGCSSSAVLSNVPGDIPGNVPGNVPGGTEQSPRSKERADMVLEHGCTPLCWLYRYSSKRLFMADGCSVGRGSFEGRVGEESWVGSA